MKFDSKTIPLIIGALVMAGGAYWFFFGRSETDPSLVATAPQGQANLRFKMLVAELKPITFNTEIFSDERFTSLVDLTTPLVPEQFGRIDPFAVISGLRTE